MYECVFSYATSTVSETVTTQAMDTLRRVVFLLMLMLWLWLWLLLVSFEVFRELSRVLCLSCLCPT